MKDIMMMLLALVASLSVQANHWTPNPYQFPDNMNVVAVIEFNGEEQANGSLEIGAFCNDECRGSEMLAYYPSLDRYMIFLTLYGQYGNQFEFRLYDHGTQREFNFDCENSVSFASGQILGSIDEPYVFSFTGAIFNVTLDLVPEEGGAASGAGIYLLGDQCTLSATANMGFRFVAWQEDDAVLSTEMVYGFSVDANHHIVAVFEPDGYTIEAEANPAEGGHVIGAGFYDTGALCTLEAVENPGYAFVSWTEEGVVLGEEPTLSFPVVTDHRIVAHFEQLVYHVGVEANPAEGGSIVGAGDYHYGDTVSLCATAASGFFFIHWEEEGEVVSTNASYQFVVEASHDFVALFALDCHQVEAVADPVLGGSISGAGNYIDGTTCTLQAQPRPGYAFLNWTENGDVVASQATFSFVVETDRSLVAHFEHIVYHITVSAEPEIGGSVIGGGDYHYGETCVVEALPAHNYDFDRWKENGGTISAEPNYSFNVMRNRDLVAHFVYFDQLEEIQNDAYTAYCVNRQIVVGTKQGETFVVKHVVDLQGRCVHNSNLATGLYVVVLEEAILKVVVR